jgi:hypothetical protein
MFPNLRKNSTVALALPNIYAAHSAFVFNIWREVSLQDEYFLQLKLFIYTAQSSGHMINGQTFAGLNPATLHKQSYIYLSPKGSALKSLF